MIMEYFYPDMLLLQQKYLSHLFLSKDAPLSLCKGNHCHGVDRFFLVHLEDTSDEALPILDSVLGIFFRLE